MRTTTGRPYVTKTIQKKHLVLGRFFFCDQCNLGVCSVFFANKIYFSRTRGVFLCKTSLVLNIDLHYSLQWFNITNTVGEGFPLPIYPTNKSFATANYFKQRRGGYHPPAGVACVYFREAGLPYNVDRLRADMESAPT